MTKTLLPSVLLALSGSCLAQETTTIIAETGDVAPHTGGMVIDSLGAFRVNANGDFFTRFLVAPEVGEPSLDDVIAYLWRDGSFERLFRNGDDAPGIPGYVFTGAVPVGPSETGALAFRMGVEDPMTNDAFNVLYVYQDGVFTEITRQGAEGEGVPGSAIEQFQNLAIAPNGDVSFLAELLTGNGFNTGNNKLAMAYRAGQLNGYARNGEPAPGVTGKNFSAFGIPAIAPDGDLFFSVGLSGFPFNEGAYTLSGPVPELLYFQGDPPEIAPNQRIESLVPVGADLSGDYAFRGFLADFPFVVNSNDDGIIGRTRDGVFEIALREGQVLEGFSTGTTSASAELRTNEALDIAAFVRIDLPNPIPDVNAIYLLADGEPELIVAQRDPAPGMPGREFQIVEDDFVMNAMGDIVFRAEIADVGAPFFTGDRTLALYDAVRDEVRIIVSTPSLIDADPDPAVTDLRTVTGVSFEFDDFKNGAGYHGLGDGRQIAYTLAFDDGSERSYLLTLNDPDTGSCCLPDQRAVVVTESRCNDLDGVYAGNGVFGARTPCTGFSTCSADFDGDFDVDLGDFGVFGTAFGAVTGDANYNPAVDFNSDGSIDLGDFGVFGAQFGSIANDCS